MCGIAGFYFFTPNDKIDQNKLLDALVWGINSRGGDACGLSAFNENGLILHEKAAGGAKEFIQGRYQLSEPALFAMVHTRFATQGFEGFMRNNHPVVSEGVHVTHNGHITNDSEVFKKIKIPRRAEVDTEAIPAYVASVGWENWRTALEDLDGGMAVAMAHEDHPGELILAKGSTSPLVYFTNGKILVWASTAECLLGAWKAAIGKPPMGGKIKYLTMGDAIIIKDGEFSLERFKAKISKWSSYGTWYEDNEDPTVGYVKDDTAQGGWRRISLNQQYHQDNWDARTQQYSTTARQSAGVLMPGKNRGEVSAANRAALGVEVEVMRAEVDVLRRRTDEILKMDDGWYREPALLKEFNDSWEKIRQLKDEIEDTAWLMTNGAVIWDAAEGEWEEAEPDPMTMIQCPACMTLTPMADMDTRPGIDAELYCEDCLSDWDSFTREG